MSIILFSFAATMQCRGIEDLGRVHNLPVHAGTDSPGDPQTDSLLNSLVMHEKHNIDKILLTVRSPLNTSCTISVYLQGQ